MTTDTKRRQSEQDLLNFMSAEDGRRFMWGLIEELTRSNVRSFAGEATHATAFNEGRRSVGLELTHLCQRIAPTEYVDMVREALDRRRLQGAAAKEGRDGGRDEPGGE